MIGPAVEGLDVEIVSYENRGLAPWRVGGKLRHLRCYIFFSALFRCVSNKAGCLSYEHND